jgi:hypothetical protein
MTAGRLAFPARPPWPFSASPKLCGRAFEDSAIGVRDGRSPDRAHPPWPLPPLRSLHPYPGRSPTVVNHRSSPAASPGIRRYAPPSTSFRVRARQRCRRRDVSGCHSRDSAARVVLHHLSGLPSPKVAGVLQPAADPGVRRVSERAALLPDESGGRARRHPRDAVRTPRRIPSPIAAPRHRGRCTSCGSTDLRAPPDRFRSRTETPDAPADPMGSGRPIARPTSTHPPGASTTTEVTASFPRHRSGPLVRPRPVSPTLAGRKTGTRLDRGEWAASGPCSTDEFVPCAPDWIPERRSTVLPGLRSPSRSSLPHPCGRDRRRHRRSGRGHRAPIRRPVDACRARCDEDHQAPGLAGRRHRQAGSSAGHGPLRVMPPGSCSRRTGDGIPPRVHRATACAATRRSRSLSGAGVGEAGPSFTARFDPSGE